MVGDVVSDCSLRSLRIALGSRLLRRQSQTMKRVCSLLLSTATRDPPGAQSGIPGAEGRGLTSGSPASLASGACGPSEPRVNLIIYGRGGGWRRRYDLAYEELRLIIEYDCRQHAEDTRQWLTDIFRREELDQIRWRLVIITSEGIYREPLRTLE
jgi:hypothetical protein